MIDAGIFAWDGNTGAIEYSSLSGPDASEIITSINVSNGTASKEEYTDTIYVRSPKTDRVMKFEFFETHRDDDNEIKAWEFRCYNDLTYYTIIVFND